MKLTFGYSGFSLGGLTWLIFGSFFGVSHKFSCIPLKYKEALSSELSSQQKPWGRKIAVHSNMLTFSRDCANLNWPSASSVANSPLTQWLKITQNVAFRIASEASYIYILSGQKFIKNAKNGQFGDFWKSDDWGQTVLPDRSLLIWQKLVQTAKNWLLPSNCKHSSLRSQFWMRHFWWFSNTV